MEDHVARQLVSEMRIANSLAEASLKQAKIANDIAYQRLRIENFTTVQTALAVGTDRVVSENVLADISGRLG